MNKNKFIYQNRGWKSRKNNKSILISFIILTFILFSSFIYSLNNIMKFDYTNQNHNLNISAPNEAPIFIDGNSTGVGAHNWSWAETQTWCTGVGTFSNPYIIRDIIINGQESSIPLEIINSEKYLEIINCTTLNCSTEAGIVLNNVNNTKIIDCDSSYNLGDGISLNSCFNNTIENFTAFNNRNDGIELVNSPNCILKNNNIKRNSYFSSSYGITIDNSDLVNIINNEFYWVAYGIHIIESNHLIINHNNLTRTPNRGINIQGICTNNTISENEIYNVANTGSGYGIGIRIVGSTDIIQSNSNIENNYIFNCYSYGIYISSVYTDPHDDITVFNNTIENSGTGIYCRNSRNGYVANNTINKCKTGISVTDNCYLTIIEYNKMSGGGMSIDFDYILDIKTTNTVNGNSIYYYVYEPNLNTANFTSNGYPGQIILRDCPNSVIDGFTLSNYSQCISVFRCDNIQIINNIVHNSTGIGISVENSHYSNISNNRLFYNERYGMDISNCQNSNIKNNNASFNDYTGLDISGYNNTIEDNIANNNRIYGISLYSELSTIENNTICNNGLSGLYLWTAHDSEIYNNTIESNLDHGIYNSGSDNVNITKNIIKNNINAGIRILNAENTKGDRGGLINNNTISYNNAGGIVLETSYNISLIYNNLTSNVQNIILDSCINCSAVSNTIYLGEQGIYSDYSNHITLDSNYIIDCIEGIKSYRTEYLSLYNNNLINSSINFGNYYYDFTYLSTMNVSLDNTVDGKTLYIYINSTNLTENDFFLFGDPYIIMLINCNDSIINDMQLVTYDVGIILYACNNIIINNSIFLNCSIGIYTIQCSSINITECDFIYNTVEAIRFSYTSDLLIESCNISFNFGSGIRTDAGLSDNIIIRNNDFYYNSESPISLSADNIDIINNRICYNGFPPEQYYGYNGISIWACENLTISNNIIKNNSGNGISFGFVDFGVCKIADNFIEYNNYGILLDETVSSELYLINNTIKDSKGIGGLDWIWSSPYVEISYNTLINCDFNFDYRLPYSFINWNITLTNTINGKIIYAYINTTGLNSEDFTFLGDPSKIILINCHNSIIENFNLAHLNDAVILHKCSNILINNLNLTYTSSSGIYIDECINIEVDNCIISHNLQRGIFLIYGNQFLTIKNCLFQNNSIGIISTQFIADTENIEISNNIFKQNEYGIDASYGDYFNIIGNQFIENENYGIRLSYLYFATIENNEFLSNINSGVILYHSCRNSTIYNNIFWNNSIGLESYSNSEYNLIYFNNFTQNILNAIENNTSNKWDNGKFGNYWDNYIGEDLDLNGIGDTPYNIQGIANATDNFPIVNFTLINPPTTPSTDRNLILIIVISLIIAISVLTLLIFARLSYDKFKPQKKISEPTLGKPASPVVKLEDSTPMIQEVLREEFEREVNLADYQPQQIPQPTNKNYKAIVKHSPHLKEYLETNKLIEDIPKMENYITSLSDPETIRKLSLLDLTLKERGLLIEDLVNLAPEERRKLINKMLENIN